MELKCTKNSHTINKNARSNRTFMELKLDNHGVWRRIIGSNRTFMELKFVKVMSAE